MAENKKEIQEFSNPNSESDQLIRLDKLPPGIARLGKMLVKRTSENGDEGTKFHSLECGINKINDLAKNDQSSLFSALFPGISDEIGCTYGYFNQLTKLSEDRSSYSTDYTLTHVARNTEWLINFSREVQGFEDQNIYWFIEHERYFYGFWRIFAALIATKDELRPKIVRKVTADVSPEDNVYTFLCVPLDIGKNYLERALDHGSRYLYSTPVHPLAVSYAYEYAINKGEPELSRELAQLIHLCRRGRHWSTREQEDTDTKAIIRYLRNPELITSTILEGSPDDIYYALFATAFQDQKKVVPYLAQVLSSNNPEKTRSGIDVMIYLNSKEVVPLVLDIIRGGNRDILRELFSPRFDFGRCNYFDRYLRCYKDLLAEIDLFERLEKVYEDTPDIIMNPHHVFINYLGRRSVKRLAFLGEMTGEDMYDLVCDQAAKLPKDLETIEFLLNPASVKYKVASREAYLGYLIRMKSLEGLQDVDLPVDQLLQVIGIDPGIYEDLQAYILDFLLLRDDSLLHELLVKGCSNKKKSIRMGVMRLMVELNKHNRFSSLIYGLINVIRSNKKLTEDEIVYLNAILDKRPSVVNYEDLLALKEVNGVENLFGLLYGLRNKPFSRGLGLAGKINEKIKRCLPQPEDSLARFTNLVAANNVSKVRLVELAFYAPQWRPFIAGSFGKDRFVEAIDWFTQCSNYVDIKNINEIYLNLRGEIWQLLVEASRYSLTPREHTKIKVFSEALFGNNSPEVFVRKFEELDLEKHWYARDYMMAIGILPLKPGPYREKDIIHRFQFIKEYIRQSKQFGEKRRTGNEEAGSVALSNLARNAGYSDIKAFEFAIETEAMKDLAGGPFIMMIDNYEITLSLNDQGGPELQIHKDGKMIKSMPEKLKKHEDVIALKERVKQIKRQASRLRLFLEEAMCSYIEYSITEFLGLMSHPILKPMMQKLIFVSKNGMGYPTGNDLRLNSYDGTAITFDENDHLKIAHPYDLLQSGHWDKWQHECFVYGRVQPFKQVFREVYIVTDAEKNPDHETGRFDGQIVNGWKALALLANRGWSEDHKDEAACIPYKGYPRQRIWAVCDTLFPEFFGDEVRMGRIHFIQEGGTVPLENVPPLIFSETMRDIDLVVSVAHAKDSPWESSTSTVESRAALVRETCQLLQLGNVRIEDHFAMVDGTLASYKVHLGSGSIHQVPGNYVCVIPDNTKFQGKLFLPFIDKDEMTSIILSKIILLAHDEKIKDTVILNQIKGIG